MKEKFPKKECLNGGCGGGQRFHPDSKMFVHFPASREGAGIGSYSLFRQRSQSAVASSREPPKKTAPQLPYFRLPL
jgi:hypothetical protein